MFVLIEMVRSGCESDCMLESCIFVSNSKKSLEKKQAGLIAEQEHIMSINIIFVSEWKTFLRNRSFSEYKTILGESLEGLRDKFVEKHSIDRHFLQPYDLPEFFYEIEKVKEI